MTIGIDARFYSESGVGRYLRNLIQELKILDKKNEYFIFLLPGDLNKFTESKNFKKVSVDFRWYGFAEQFKFPKFLNEYKLDLMHFPHFNVPIFYSGKFVVTIHDLIHQHFSMKRTTALNPFAFKIKQFGYRKVFKNAVTKSCKILVPSNSVGKLLEEEWKVEVDKIVVTPEAVDDKIIRFGQRVLDKLNVKQRYIFYIGNAHPHKNVEGLITTYLKLREKDKGLKLILTGGDSFFWQRIKKEHKGVGLVYTGFISDEDLVALYKNALCLVVPSFEEGFGLPVLEAMSCGCPVVCSNTGALKEVGGDAALYFDPLKPAEMGNIIQYVQSNVSLRKKLIEKGKKRVKLFSWKRLARKTLEVYESCNST